METADELLKGRYAPVLLELVPFSGERICVTVALEMSDGTCYLVPTLIGKQLKRVFGEHALGVARFIILNRESMTRQIAEGGDLFDWDAPIEGMLLGNVGRIKERDVRSMLDSLMPNLSGLWPKGESVGDPEQWRLGKKADEVSPA